MQPPIIETKYKIGSVVIRINNTQVVFKPFDWSRIRVHGVWMEQNNSASAEQKGKNQRRAI
jgi:hypothetical protein